MATLRIVNASGGGVWIDGVPVKNAMAVRVKATADDTVIHASIDIYVDEVDVEGDEIQVETQPAGAA